MALDTNDITAGMVAVPSTVVDAVGSPVGDTPAAADSAGAVASPADFTSSMSLKAVNVAPDVGVRRGDGAGGDESDGDDNGNLGALLASMGVEVRGRADIVTAVRNTTTSSTRSPPPEIEDLSQENATEQVVLTGTESPNVTLGNEAATPTANVVVGGA